MLFQSSVPYVLNKIAADYSDAARAARQKETAKRLDYYSGQQLTALYAILEKMFTEPERLQLVTLNLVKKIIDNKAGLYRVPPLRELSGSDKDKKIYAAICAGSQLDLKMKMASRYAKLLRSLLLRVVWRGDHLDVDLICGNLLHSVTTSDTPSDLLEVAVIDYGRSNKPEDVTFSVWDPEEWRQLDYRGETIASMPNPYSPHLPFIAIFDGVPSGSEFFQEGGSDLIAQQEALNVRLVDLCQILHFQSHGVGFMRNNMSSIDPLTEEAPIKIGPNVLVELTGPDSEIGYVSQKAALMPMLNAIDRLVKWSSVLNGLSAGSVSLDTSESSGVSKVWDSIELAESRIEDKIVFSAFEQNLFRLIKLVNNVHAPAAERLSEACELKINYSDPPWPTVSPLDEAQAYMTLSDLGVVSPVDILMARDRDINSRAEAIERLKEIKGERELLAPPRTINLVGQPASSQS